MLLDQFSARTVHSGPISGHFRCFGPNLKIRSGPNLARSPQPGVRNPNQIRRFRNFFLDPIPELFFCAFFAAFPGNSSNNVDPADPTKFAACPGNALNYVGSNPDLAFLAPGMPSLGLSRRNLMHFLDMLQISSGRQGRHYLMNFLEMLRKTRRKKVPEWDPKKNSGICGSG